MSADSSARELFWFFFKNKMLKKEKTASVSATAADFSPTGTGGVKELFYEGILFCFSQVLRGHCHVWQPGGADVCPVLLATLIRSLDPLFKCLVGLLDCSRDFVQSPSKFGRPRGKHFTRWTWWVESTGPNEAVHLGCYCKRMNGELSHLTR